MTLDKSNKSDNSLMDKIVSLAKRRGFVFPSSEIYGGFAGVYDYGHLGVALKTNVKEAWRGAMKTGEQEIVEVDSGILMHPKIWEASGHTSAGFSDPLRECKSCHKRWRADQLDRETCPECGGGLTESKNFNLLVETHLGPVKDETSLAYLRGETAQGIYMHFKDTKDSMRMEIPFGIAQIGKAFRNEITPRHFIFRTREFEQMEMQFFIKPGEQDKWFDYWKHERMQWHAGLGVNKENLRFRDHAKNELAHYATAACDIEYQFPFGWSEIEGIHNRGDWDLSNHSKMSGQDLSYFDPQARETYIPYIIETSVGLDRSILAVLLDSYREEGKGKEKRVYLKLHPRLAPYKVAVFPLLANKPDLVKLARSIYDELRPHVMTAWDDRGNIGKRYYAQDEIGTPFCITVDFQSREDRTVTVRNRDTTKQVRVNIDELRLYLQGRIW